MPNRLDFQENWSETYGSFLSELSALLEDENICIIYDNAPPHRDAHVFNENHLIQPFPRYSPFLNPTEQAISCLKSAVKRDLSEPSLQSAISDHEAARQLNLTLHGASSESSARRDQ